VDDPGRVRGGQASGNLGRVDVIGFFVRSGVR